MGEIQHSSDALFGEAFHVSPAGNVIMRCSDSAIVEINAACLRMLGYERHELLGQHVKVLRLIPESQGCEEVVVRTEDHGGAEREVTFVRKDGSSGHGLYCNHPMKCGGERYGLATLIDITGRKRVEQSHLRDSTPRVAVDAIQIHQIVMNLATNAAHAIGSKGGLIEITLRQAMIDRNSMPTGWELPDGNYTCLSFSDNGAGMDRAILGRIFEPFFTTRPRGKGTGLGLSVIHGIVQNLGGAIFVDSRPGNGTRFEIYFPAVSIGPCAPAEVAPAPSPGRGQRVLYVDDEEALVLLITRVLERLGYRVDAYTDPAKALAAVRNDPQGFDVVVTDLSMHTMSGFELARAILAVRSDLPVLLTSGYIRSEDRETARQCGIREVILKPDTVEELGHSLNRLFLDRDAQSSVTGPVAIAGA